MNIIELLNFMFQYHKVYFNMMLEKNQTNWEETEIDKYGKISELKLNAFSTQGSWESSSPPKGRKSGKRLCDSSPQDKVVKPRLELPVYLGPGGSPK